MTDNDDWGNEQVNAVRERSEVLRELIVDALDEEISSTNPAIDRLIDSLAGWVPPQQYLAEVVRFRHWQQEAMVVMGGLQELGHALGLAPGTLITGTLAAETAERLAADRTRLLEVLRDVRAPLDDPNVPFMNAAMAARQVFKDFDAERAAGEPS